jgi:cytidine deaminase
MTTPDHATTDPVAALIAEALRAAGHAHAPYSGWRVGAAAEFADQPGAVHRGANVENGSYGLTICAERTAIFAGVVAGARRLRRVALVCRDRDGAAVPEIVPCGACLQVMTEFGGPDTEIVIEGTGTFRIRDFLPRPFGAGVTVPRAGT